MKRIPIVVTLVVALLLPGSVALSQVTGAATTQLGKVNFQTSCTPAAQAHFLRGVAMLHSFWLDAAIKEFTEAAAGRPHLRDRRLGCRDGVDGQSLGRAAESAGPEGRVGGAREGQDHGQQDAARAGMAQRHREDLQGLPTRSITGRAPLPTRRRWSELSGRYPDDREAAVFYALALNMTLNPNDKTYANQLKAAGILEKVFADQPQHPGVAHYLIHSYDYPADRRQGADGGTALREHRAGCARTRCTCPRTSSRAWGSWQESIDSNRGLGRAAQDAARAGNTIGLRSYDVAARLRLHDVRLPAAREGRGGQGLDRRDPRATRKLNVDHFAGAFALAAIPARYTLERGRWADAAALTPMPSDLGWDKFPQAESITWFARASARRGAATLPTPGRAWPESRRSATR